MKNNALVLLIFLIMMGACQPEESTNEPLTGVWRFVLDSDGGAIPFLMEFVEENGRTIAFIRNGEEKLLVDSLVLHADSVIIPLHIFDAALLARRQGGDTLEGQFIRFYVPDKTMSFTAVRGQTYRFFPDSLQAEPAFDFSGRWAVTFTKPDGRQIPAIALFEQVGTALRGTFMTETGDFRYLEGNVAGRSLYLSAFDGARAALFVATSVDGERLKGDYWLGKDHRESWVASRSDTATLRNPYELTYLKPGYTGIDFALPNLQGDTVRLSDERFRGKAIIVQILGSWCPNCMDETAFLAEWYKKRRPVDVEVVGLAFERKPDFDYARRLLLRMKQRYKVDYELLFAGVAEKGEPERVLPMLNHVISYPTTIFIDKQGKVRHIHTGFYGPGTGEFYTQWQQDFYKIVADLQNP